MDEQEKLDTPKGLTAYLSPAGAWAFALGTSIGWGSLVVTSNTYLAQAGPVGSILGLTLGLLIMIVIAACYHFLMNHSDARGGIYAYARDIFGYDHAALTAWFLLLTYAAMLWANATSLQLFSRFFFGNIFQFGFHYTLFGYDIYLGEALLSIAFIVLAGGVCTIFKKGVSRSMVIMCAIIVVGIVGCFCAAMAQRDVSQFAFDPKFHPGTSPLAQVLGIATISTWAFIGFENISCSTDEFAFSRKKSFHVFVAALVVAGVLYALLILLSISAYPPEYGSWMDYIADLSNQSGVAAIPAFYAANYYLGQAGTIVLMVVLLCLVFTSLIGNIVALSRLIFALADDQVISDRYAQVNDYGVPGQAIALVVIVSVFVPFVGRTAIGWVVDVTTIGATLIYAFVAVCAYRDGRAKGNQLETACGVVGIAFMIIFGINLLLPAIFESGAMATESYFIITVWSVLGFVVFRILLQRDKRRVFGRSIVAWVVLLGLVLTMSAAWMGMVAVQSTAEATEEIMAYEAGTLDASLQALPKQEFVSHVMSGIGSDIAIGAVIIAALCMFSFSIMLSNFTVVQRREEESHERAKTAHETANTDPLTGVKSKHAYVTRESDLNYQLEAGELHQLGVVVCDVNGLKQVNDTLGHKAGDEYIRSAATLICNFFKHSPVYRIGGDEFVVLLEGQDFLDRRTIIDELDAKVEENRDAGEVVVAVGMATLIKGMDKEVHAIFERADALMYQRKKELKRPGEEIR